MDTVFCVFFAFLIFGFGFAIGRATVPAEKRADNDADWWKRGDPE